MKPIRVKAPLLINFRIAFCLFALSLIVCLALSCPVDVAGKWSGDITIMSRTGKIALELKVDGKVLTGTATIEGRDSKILDGKVEADALSFGLDTGAHDAPRLEFAGKVDGEKMKLSITGTDPTGTVHQMGDVDATRVK